MTSGRGTGRAMSLGTKEQAPAPGADQDHRQDRAPSARTSQGIDAVRATVHRRATSTFEKSSASSATLTPALRQGIENGARRARPLRVGKSFLLHYALHHNLNSRKWRDLR